MTVEQGLRAEFTLSKEVLAWVEALPYDEKVKARLKRQMVRERVKYIPSSLRGAIIYENSPEGSEYWCAVDVDEPNPDQYLPEDYVDVEDAEISEVAGGLVLPDVVASERKLKEMADLHKPSVENGRSEFYIAWRLCYEWLSSTKH